MSTNAQHNIDRVKLTSEAIVELFRLELIGGGTIFLKNDNTVTWQGHTWEGLALNVTGYSNNSDQELSRPTLSIANPEGILSQYIISGAMEKAIVKRIRVLKSNLDSNLNIFEQHSWYISRVIVINKAVISFELRNPVDGPQFQLPPRKFLPPEYPAVRL